MPLCPCYYLYKSEGRPAHTMPRKAQALIVVISTLEGRFMADMPIRLDDGHRARRKSR
jgi:hypothetical protein